MNVLRSCDLFGSQFNFSSFGTTTFKTRLGGLASVLLALSTIAISVIFGKDFYNRTNPYVISRLISSNQTDYLEIDKEKFPIAFRFQNARTEAAIENSAFSILAVYSKNNAESSISVVDCEDLKITNSSLANAIGEVQAWKCLDFTKEANEIGGIDKYFYINFRILKSETSKLSENSALVRVVLPEYLFYPEDTIRPLHSIHKSYYRNVGLGLRKFVDYYFSKPNLKDDQGIIYETEANFDVLTLNDYNFDSIFNNELTEVGEWMTVCTLSFYYRSEYTQYVRKFDKIQDVIANIGGFVQIIFYCFWVFLFPFTEYKMNSKFVNSYFSFGELEETLLIKSKLLKEKKSLIGKLKKSFIMAKKIEKSNERLTKVVNDELINPEKVQEEDNNPRKEVRKSTKFKLPSSAVQKLPEMDTVEPIFSNGPILKEARCKSYEIGNKDMSFSCNFSVDSPISCRLRSSPQILETPKVIAINQVKDKATKLRYLQSEGSSGDKERTKTIKGINFLNYKFTARDLNKEMTYTSMTQNLNKFDYFYNNLEFFAEKKKSGFDLSLTPDLEQEIRQCIAKMKESKSHFKVSFCRFLALSMCHLKSNRLFHITKEIIDQKLDISNYLKLMLNVEKLKKITLNYYQGLSLNYQAKPNILDEDLVEELSDLQNKNLIEVLAYFFNRDEFAKMDNIDYLCLQEFEQPLKELIFEKCGDIKNFYKRINTQD